MARLDDVINAVRGDSLSLLYFFIDMGEQGALDDEANPLPENMPQIPAQQNAPVLGQPRGYV